MINKSLKTKLRKERVDLIEVKKKQISPAYGFANIHNRTIYLDKTLHSKIKAFVIQHEFAHVYYKTKSETFATVYGFMHEPMGYLFTFISNLMSLKRIKHKVFGVKIKSQILREVRMNQNQHI